MHTLPDRSGPVPSPAIWLTILAVLIPVLVAVNMFAGAFKVGGGGSSFPNPAAMTAAQQETWASTLHTQLLACLGEEGVMLQAIPAAMDAAMAKAQAGDLTNYGLNPLYGRNLKKICDASLVGPAPTDLAPGAVAPARTLENEWRATLANAAKLQQVYTTPMTGWVALLQSMSPS